MSEPAVRLKGVTKSFGPTRAVHSMDLSVPRGRLYGVIGPNGAGKTTTIRMIMSILFPDAGEIAVLGHPSALDAKDRIGYLPEERGVYRKMRVSAFLTYMGRLKGVPDSELPGGPERVAEACAPKIRLSGRKRRAKDSAQPSARAAHRQFAARQFRLVPTCLA